MRFPYIRTIIPFIIWLVVGFGAVLAAPKVGGYEGGSWKMVGKNDNIIAKGPKVMMAPRQTGYMFGVYAIGGIAVCCCCHYLRCRKCCCGCDCCHNAPKC